MEETACTAGSGGICRATHGCGGSISLVLILAVVYVLFQYVFPWAEPLLPFGDVTVDGQGAGEPGAGR
ncbi:hypothetical protein SCALM49S_04511 [Streptomyces californicus]